MRKQVIEVVSAVIERDRHYLLTQRTSTAVLPLLWEFPGGKVEAGETKRRALVREVEERIGLTVSVGEIMAENTHEYDTYSIHMTLFRCDLPRRCEPTAKGVAQVRWVESDNMKNYEFPPADKLSMSRLLRLAH